MIMHLPPSRRLRLLPLLAVLGATLACAPTDQELSDEGPAVRTSTQAATGTAADELEIQTSYDDSASPVHIQIKQCTTVGHSATQQVDCRVDPEFALVGGGAHPFSYGMNAGGSFLTESRPLDARTWRASSSEHLISQAHYLRVYAIGMRLDGVNTQQLREAVSWSEVSTAEDSLIHAVSPGSILLGAGAQATPDAAAGEINRFLTTTAPHDPSTNASWRVASADHFLPAEGITSLTLLELEDRIIEGFGALEIRSVVGQPQHVSAGYGVSNVLVEEGWALIGLGAEIENDAEQTGRMLTAIMPGEDARSASVFSRDQIDASAGTTTAIALQARKVPGSHGLCNAGTALEAQMDSCVADICEQRAECCNQSWDESCVSLVESICERSCATHTCTPTTFEPARWIEEDGSPVASNCYYYAQNKYPDGKRMDPGYTLELRDDDFSGYSRFTALAAGEGLIPSTLEAPCSDNRTKVYLYANPYSYHMYRQDADGEWSDKFASSGYAEFTENEGKRPQANAPQNNPVEAYFCACNQPLPALDGLSASLSITNTWATGYCADVTVTNNGAEALSEWSLSLLPNSSVIDHYWGVTLQESSGSHTGTSLPWNTLAPGSSTSFGFCATKLGDAWTPTVETL